MTLHVRKWSLLSWVWVLAACSASNAVKLDSAQHLQTPAAPAARPNDIPQPVQRSFVLPPPKPQVKTETYSVVVDKVPVHELLFALARDAKVNVDIHPGITGTVTLNALDQTLPQLLTRIARQVDMRFEIDGPNLAVMPDLPFLRHYRADYVNLSRIAKAEISVNAQITSSEGRSSRSTSQGTTGSASTTSIATDSKNSLWQTLVTNLGDILRETGGMVVTNQTACVRNENAGMAFQGNSDSVIAGAASARSANEGATQASAGSERLAAKVNRQAEVEGSQGSSDQSSVQKKSSSKQDSVCSTTEFTPAAYIIPNIEAGVISVRATARQHEKVQAFLDTVLSRVKRQVLIDVTVAEVQLSQNYQQGIDWSALNLFDTGLRLVQKAAGSIGGPSANMVELGYASRGGNFSSTVKLLDSFGTVKILSSPKLSVLNNQTAVMKVVDDSVYFTYEVSSTQGTANNAATTTVTSTLHTVPVGLVLSLTPQIGDDDSVTLNIRPSISRIIGQKDDPSLDLYKTGTTIRNTIPLIRSREFDSVMRVADGNIAVMGGLMEDLLQNNDNAVPGLSNTPLFGGLFQNRDDTKRKTELVIFVRPTIIRDASLEGDFGAFKSLLPNERFFDRAAGPALIPGGPQ